MPILGTGAGAALGGLGGLLHSISNPDTYNTVDFSPGASAAVKARRAAEFSNNYNEALEGLKNQNPLKRMAAEEYNQNAMRNLEFQRSLGLNYSSFHGAGGFKDQAINAGFTPEMAMQMSGQIIGAGGSTRMGRGSVLGLQAARNLDVTNAGSILGGLSQTLGSGKASEDAFTKMLAKGMELGLDSSEFREENRKFLDATTQVISRSETSSQGDMSDIIRRFGGFMADPTTRGIQAAQGAYQTFNQAASANTGVSGTMRAAGFIQDPVIGSMSPMDRVKLSTIPADQLSTDHPIVQDLARRYGKSPEDIVSRMQKIGAGAIHRLPQGDALTKSLIAKRTEMQGPISRARMMHLEHDIKGEENQLAGVAAVEYPELAKNRKQLESFVKGTTQPTAAGRGDFFEKMTKEGLTGPAATGRPEDETVKGMAESSKLMVQTFRELKDQIVPTADAIAHFNARLKETVDTIMKMPEAERSGLLQRLYSNLTGQNNDKSTTQTQGGK